MDLTSISWSIVVDQHYYLNAFYWFKPVKYQELWIQRPLVHTKQCHRLGPLHHLSIEYNAKYLFLWIQIHLQLRKAVAGKITLTLADGILPKATNPLNPINLHLDIHSKRWPLPLNFSGGENFILIFRTYSPFSRAQAIWWKPICIYLQWFDSERRVGFRDFDHTCLYPFPYATSMESHG